MEEDAETILLELNKIQKDFCAKFGVKDIYTNSRFFEMIIANVLNHNLIPGFSGNRDAKDSKNNEYEYKHYKESSSNHTWTFNDFSDSTIKNLNTTEAVVFAHINDIGEGMPFMDWCYIVPGKLISKFLKERTIKIKNTRKMINVSPSQIEKCLEIKRINFEKNVKGKYDYWLNNIYELSLKIEKFTECKDILTSNRIWEVLVALKLHHKILSNQKKYDAKDSEGNLYEYKVSKSSSWNFEDITDNVLNKFSNVKKIILAIVDKENLKLIEIYEINPSDAVKRLREKLNEKRIRYESKGGLRRLQVSLNKGDLRDLKAKSLL
jgi:hypothetical protein